MSEGKPRTWAAIAFEKAYERGKRQGYASGMAEGMIESLSDAIAKRLSEVLQEIVAENLLHCLEKGRAEGLRQALATITRLRFGDDSEAKFKDLTTEIESAETLEAMFRSAIWSKTEEDWIVYATREIESARAKAEAEDVSTPSN